MAFFKSELAQSLRYRCALVDCAAASHDGDFFLA